MVAADMIFAYIFISLLLCGFCLCYCCSKTPSYRRYGIIELDASAHTDISAPTNVYVQSHSPCTYV